MEALGHAADHAFIHRCHVIRLEFDRREPAGTLRQIGKAAIARTGIRERNDRTRVQVTVDREVLPFNLQLCQDATLPDRRDLDTEFTGEMLDVRLVEVLGRRFHQLSLSTAPILLRVSAGLAVPSWSTLSGSTPSVVSPILTVMPL